jgi:hypothetical protein
MNSNIKPNPEQLKRAVDNFLNESAPYYAALSKIAMLKPQRIIINTADGTITSFPSEDTQTEIKIKTHIETIRDKHLGEFEIKN